jgi:hypothetical protein
MTIKDTEEHREYTLEFTRKTVTLTERAGFELDKMDSAPMTMISLLWWGAFLANHPYMRKEDADKLLDKFGGITWLANLTNKDGENGVEYLGKLYGVPFNTLKDNEQENPPAVAAVEF